jgi:predicted permease
MALNLHTHMQNYAVSNKIYDILYSTFNSLGKTTTPLSMIFIGLMSSEIKLSNL